LLRRKAPAGRPRNGSVEKTFAAWADEIRQTRERHDRIGRDEAILTEKLAGIDRNRAATRTSIAEIDAEIRDGDGRLADLERSLRSLDAEIAAITTHADPRAESEEIGRTIEARKSALARTQKEEALRAQAMEVARTERDRHQAETKKAAGRAAESARRADESLREAGFEDVMSARAALRSPSDIDALDAGIETFRRDLDAVRRRISELDVGGPPVDAGQVAVLENDVKALERESQELLTTLVRHQESARRLERELLRQEEVERDRAATNRRLTVYRQLTDDLKSDRFQAYMLEETLADLVRGASEQLGRLTSQRFGLCFEEDAIRVVDLDNAGEVRSADTLSGGETFLASLALALELSAQVQRAVGAVSLDCLFIDEGFGTLDPDSIALVADSIRGLQVGGRMVGIITHLPDFIEQFDQRVFVEKSAGVSSLRVETVEA
jgi:exonuclease SbcC